MGLHLKRLLSRPGMFLSLAIFALPLLLAASGNFLTDTLGTIVVILEVAAGLGMVIFVHELGHFAVAKWCGVQCDKFYLGFDINGWKLFSFQWGETEYGIGVLPLGGYVKMLGQDDNPARMAEELERAKLAKSEDGGGEQLNPRSYIAQSVPKRMAIISAGVIMNVIFAFVLNMLAYRMGVHTIPTEVSAVEPGLAAWGAGMQPGDTLLQVGQRKTVRFRDLKRAVALDSESGEAALVRFQRPGVDQPVEVSVVPDTTGDMPIIGVAPTLDIRLAEERPVRPGWPAAKAEPAFTGNDRIISVDGKPIEKYYQIREASLANTSKTMTIVVEQQDGKQASIDVNRNPFHELGLIMTMGPITAVQDGSPAMVAGLRPGDLITTLNGKPVGNPMTMPQRLRELAGQEVAIGYQRDSKEQTVKLIPRDLPAWFNPPLMGKDDPMESAQLGVTYRVLDRIQGIVPDSPADKPDIKEKLRGAVVSKAEVIPPENHELDAWTQTFGKGGMSWPGFYYNDLQAVPAGSKVKLTLQNQAKPITLELKESTTDFNPDRGLVFPIYSEILQLHSWSEAVALASEETLSHLTEVFRVIQKMVSGDISPTNLGGPIRIAAAAGGSASLGLPDLMVFLAMLSANLAVINFLPIPVLDGGHMLFLTVELVRGKPLNAKYQEVATLAGLGFILCLVVLVFGLDSQWLYKMTTSR